MDYVVLNYRNRKVGTRNLITNDYGSYLFLEDEEFKDLNHKNLKKDTKLYSDLKSEGFLLERESKQLKNLISIERVKYNRITKGPSLHIVVLTKRCNQKCHYCHASAVSDDHEKYDLSEENAKRYVEIIMSTPSPSVTIEFQGGEPLINFPRLQQIVLYANELNKVKMKDLRFTMVSNLEAMDDEKFDWLISHDVAICTSLDGPKHIHDMNRPSVKSESSYDKVVYWHGRLKERDLKLGALVTVTRQSLASPKEIVDEYLRQGFGSIHLRELNFLGKAIGAWRVIGYTTEDFLKFWRDAMDYILELNRNGTYFRERLCTVILEKVMAKSEPGYTDLMSPCGAIIGQIAYNYNGDIYTCDEGRTVGEDIFKVGTSADKDIKAIMSKDESMMIISSTFNDNYHCEYCTYKPYCGVCNVCNYKETGGNAVTDIKRSSRCTLFMGMFDYIFSKMQNKEDRMIFASWIDSKAYKDKNVFV